MAFEVSTSAAYAVLYSVLISFTILAVASAGWFPWLPGWIQRSCLLKLPSTEDGVKHSNSEFFLAARNAAGVWALALSYFASGMGAWVVYGTTEMGATPQLSWLGVIGYSGASAFPAILIGWWLGPMIRERSADAFSTSDFGLERYGRIMQVTIGVISIFYMFIYLVAELTSISNIFALLTNNMSVAYGIGVTVSIGAITILYTALAGLPSSIATDKFQGVIMACLVVILTVAVCAEPSNRVTREQFALASNWTVEGLMAAVTLVLAIASAELFNQSTWQRVWAAESVPSMRKGFMLGSFMVFLLMMFFGIMGMIAYALDPEAYNDYTKLAFLSFFDILEPLAMGWHILVLILVTALNASSVDSLQNGLTSVFSHDLVRLGWNPTWISRSLMVLVNIPAVYLASKKFEVIQLFLVADLVCATSVFPVFLGLHTKDRGWLKAPTELGAFLGCISGVVTVLINGIVNQAPGGVFDYFWLQNGAICSLCGSKTMVSFIITPIMSAVMTYFFSTLDITIRGDRARRPVISVKFDQKQDPTQDISSEEEEGDEEPAKPMEETEEGAAASIEEEEKK